jgi:hypothetical protein
MAKGTLNVGGGNIAVDSAGRMIVDAGATVTGTLKMVEQADADADTTAQGQLWVNTASVPELYFTGDTGTDIQITTATAVAGAFDTDAAQTFNDSGADVDFRIEGDTEQNLFFVDGGTDKVGIGTNAVSAGQGDLTVYGRMQVTRGSAFQTLTTSAWAME